MLRLIHTKQGQATTEIAIFGVLMLVVFAALMRYGMMYNAKQEAQMYTFRKALELAKLRHDGLIIKGENPPGVGMITNFLGGYSSHMPDLMGNGFPLAFPFFTDRRFAAANVNVQSNVYPVNVLGPAGEKDAQVSSVGADASVSLENEGMNFGNNILFEALGFHFLPVSREDIPGTYYQVGEVMREQKEFFEPAYVIVNRKTNDKAPQEVWDGYADLIIGEPDKEGDYWSLQPIPYREIETHSNVTASDEYNPVEGSPNSRYAQNTVITEKTQTIYHPPGQEYGWGNDLASRLFALNAGMMLWDPKVNFVVPASVEQWLQDGNMDMVVTEERTLQKERTWDARRQ